MYCTRCGKKIDYESFVCNECLAQEELLKNQAQSDVSEPAVEVKAESDFVGTVTDKADSTEAGGANQQYYYSAPNAAYNYQPRNEAQQIYVPTGNPRMIGFGKSLTSTILSFFGYIFSYIALIVSAEEEPVGGLVLLLMALGMSIPALIFGITSIKTSARVAAQKLPRPIATLVLGIVGLGFSAMALFFSFITLIIIGVS